MARTTDVTERKSFGTRIGQGLRLVGRTSFTLAVIAGAGVAVQFGASELARRAEAAPSPDVADPIPVMTTPVQMQPGYTVQRAFVGQVEAERTVSVSFELAGLLDEINVEEGEVIDAGQVIARQDTSLLLAERTQLVASRDAAEAQLTFAEQTLERSEELKRRGFATQANLDGALSDRNQLIGRIAEIDAGLANVDIRIEKSVLTAPFAGRVTARNVDGGETLSPGQAVIGLVASGAPQVRVGVPLDLDESHLQSARIEIAGHQHPAKLDALRPDIDPVTRTRTALFTIETDTPPAFGQTAILRVANDVDAPGLWLPVTSLKEGARGQWTVLAVDAEDTVRAAPVEVLHAESDRVFVRAAFPDGTRLIGEGPQRVTVGQTVFTASAE